MAVKHFDVMNIGRAGLINPEQVGYQDSIDIIKDESLKVQKSFVKIGWYLKHIRDNELYKENGYASVWECAADQLGYSQSTASRFINICEKFSKDHNSPELDIKYAGFDKSQMIEMLPMEPDQLDKVTPEMTIKQIREIKTEKKVKAPKEEQEQKADDDIPGQTSIENDFPEYLPEEKPAKQETEETESYATSHKDHNSFPLPEDKEVKMKPDVKGLMDAPYCVVCQIPLNGPETTHCPSCGQAIDWSEYIKYYGDDTAETDVLYSKDEIIDGECQEIGEHEGVPEENTDDPVPAEPAPKDDLAVTKYILTQEEKTLDDYLEVGGLPEMTVRRQKTIVCALAAMVCDLEIISSSSETENTQPELPVLKNNDQRKKWLADYKAWGP